MIHNNTTAPTVAVTSEPIKPPASSPSKRNRKPPTTAPTMPTPMLGRMPKPPPRIMLPAIQPASPPITNQAISPILLSPSSWLFQPLQEGFATQRHDDTTKD